jgi:hypothetical protein
MGKTQTNRLCAELTNVLHALKKERAGGMKERRKRKKVSRKMK